MSFRRYLPPELPAPLRQSIHDIQDLADRTRRDLAAVQQAGYLTRKEAEALYGVQALLPKLQLTGGATALNVEGLLGVLSQPQKAGIPKVDALPDVLLSQDGEVVYYNGVVYRFNASTEPGFWEPMTTQVIQDTHANRIASHPPSLYAKGTLFFETDRRILYVTRPDAGSVMRWYYISGIWSDAWANRNLEAEEGNQGCKFYATDRNLLYEIDDATGTVDTSGTSVTLTAGQHFDGDWPANTYITINGVPYQILSVSSPLSLTLTASAGTQTGVAYRVASGIHTYKLGIMRGANAAKAAIGASRAENGMLYSTTDADIHILWKFSWTSLAVNRWMYVSGWQRGALAGLPAAVSTDDGYEYYATDFEHHYILEGGTWNFAPGDSGSKFIVATAGAAPAGGLWALCDGSAVLCANADGTTSNVTTPNLTGNVFVQGGTYSGSQDIATAAKWDTGAATDSGGAHTHTTDNPGGHTHFTDLDSPVSAGPSATTVVQSGAGATVASSTHTHTVPVGGAASDSAGGHIHTALSDGAHTHTLSDANAKLKAPSETNGGLPLRIKLTWYMRR